MSHFLPAAILCILSNSVLSQEAWQASWLKAQQAAAAQDFEQAAKFASQAKTEGLHHPHVDYQLGRWSFRAGNFQASVQAFDRYLEKVPQRSNSLWERGISCYYAGQFVAGAKQFADYQKSHDSDVENAVWRYLCQLKVDGKEAAGKGILPIKHDRRVPMMEIYRLFKGEMEPADVLAALSASNALGDQAKVQAMHAHLYLGLYYDAAKNPQRALEHLRLAVEQFKAGDYMWSVAVVHENHLKAASK